MKNFLINLRILFNKVYYPFYLWWSNFFWKVFKKSVYEMRLYEVDYFIRDILAEIEMKANEVLERFHYKYDGIDELGDTMPPPAQMYYSFRCLGKVKDDCDGFHASMYHILQKNAINSQLVRVSSLVNMWKHCVVAFKLNGKVYVLDYNHIYAGNTLEEIVAEHYGEVTKHKYLIFTQTYDYKKHKYCDGSFKKIIK